MNSPWYIIVTSVQSWRISPASTIANWRSYYAVVNQERTVYGFIATLYRSFRVGSSFKRISKSWIEVKLIVRILSSLNVYHTGLYSLSDRYCGKSSVTMWVSIV